MWEVDVVLGSSRIPWHFDIFNSVANGKFDSEAPSEPTHHYMINLIIGHLWFYGIGNFFSYSHSKPDTDSCGEYLAGSKSSAAVCNDHI